MPPVTKPPLSSPFISYGRQFYKDWKHLEHDSFRKKFITLLPDFIKDPTSKKFQNHTLKGDFKELRSINITDDIRVIYCYDYQKYIFLRIGTHAYLYG